MNFPLVSPGTLVTVTDETAYATAGEGTIPLIIIGTHEFKVLPSGSGIAEGTLPENAGKLYPITSQRELLQTFGNPIFYTRNGSAVHGFELNEYGLHAAYQYLGIANRAFVIRSAIDYSQLAPRATEPRAEPANGTNWLDTQNNSWGFYEWTGSTWAERDLIIIEDEDDLDSVASPQVGDMEPPLAAIGANGDLALTVLKRHSKKALYQKLNGAWFLVGSSGWTTAKTSGPNVPRYRYGEFRPGTDNRVGDILFLHTPRLISSPSAIFNTGHWMLKTFNVTTGVWDETPIPIYPSFFESSIADVVGSVYLQMDADADNRATGVSTPRFDFTQTGTAVFEFRRYNGFGWEPLGEESGSVEPTSEPAAGTLWYNNATLRVNIKVSIGGDWVNYRTAYPLTDINGVILLGSAPTAQSTGGPLVENDLWIDTTDLENFPNLHRYNDGRWRKVNIENNIDPIEGIAFGESSTVNALNYPEGMRLFDLSESTNDVKQYVGASDDGPGFWTNVSGFQTNGVPFFGRKAQRQMIVRSLAETISSNENIRAETVYFNLLAAPGYIELIDEMVTLNTDMKEVAFIVGDTPIRLDPSGRSIQEFATNAANGNTEEGVSTFNPYVGLYYPWGLGTNVDGTEIMVPPSTIALRTIAYNDSVAYPWMAPAGFTRGLVNNATSVGYLDEEGEFRAAILNNGQRDLLYQNSINPIAFIPNRGLVVYGQKTRHSLNTALNRINVARLVNYLRFNLDVLSKPYLFEPNDFQTRDSVRTAFERFLADLVGLRGLYDFVVVCDESNNTPERIDRNELWIDIAIQPVQAIEFIYIPVRLVATGDDLGTLFQ